MAARSMAGKICMVTGATSGIGRVTARALAERGARVIVVGRSADKGATAVDDITRRTGNPAVEFMLADLSSQQAIRQLAHEFQRRHQRLDVLVNNAGALFMSRYESVDGIEMTFALNHLAYFLLTNLLLETLKTSAPARIVNVSSVAHRPLRMHLDDLQGSRRYSGWLAYGQSKLANMLFTNELARRLEGTGVTANALHPGFVATNFGLNNLRVSNPWIMKLVRAIYGLMALSEEQGAQTSIYLATSADVEGVTGKFFEKQRAVASSRASYDAAAAARLWRVSAEMTGLTVRSA